MCLNGLVRLARRAEQQADATPSTVLMEHLGLQAKEEAEVADLYSHAWGTEVEGLVIDARGLLQEDLAPV